MRWNFQDFLHRIKMYVREWMFPILVIFFIRTIFFPTFIDVLILFILFLLYMGSIFDWY